MLFSVSFQDNRTKLFEKGAAKTFGASKSLRFLYKINLPMKFYKFNFTFHSL